MFPLMAKHDGNNLKSILFISNNRHIRTNRLHKEL
ncbi:hypothetical protein QBC99_003817 [Beijerinckia sp. GAS462]|nr:hypothetical protein [Beijerinckia sp. GAS462]SEC97462.1 hypothetical protein SAMN05443249_4046 [Beijerinckia sp. 28-YEA-48]